ncbi:MAG: carbohydrate binding family 9 domain-containing protein [Acidobacteria bacterium]|nr:carbohydrate binding family 9 domain-containing protein [Acidobacteriota bacterium]MBS1865218.1 carbohydrate binding family 9 domain-containing protein [Acidobacteriota bacterium]
MHPLRQTCPARLAPVLAMLLFVSAPSALAGPQTKDSATFAKLHIPHMQKRPTIDDFESMQPSPAIAGQMLKIDGFLQRDPKDGAPISQKTEVYLGYTNENLYVICVCFDAEPNKIRTHMVRREQINDDDQFGFVLDTFADRKNGVFFFANPYGVQQDGIWNDFNEPDYSYDMLWNSQGRVNSQGYVLWFEIPFRSLRFSRDSDQTWGIFFERDIRRSNEFAFYPRITANAQGFLTQETQIDGMKDISPGRNIQFIPYGSLRSFRALDDLPGGMPHFSEKSFEPRAGLDSKIVFKDWLVFDSTINPDFAQVESDEPQTTVNQRFEVFFPEKRPFFLENSGFFDTPINLVFTRRIADPQYGLRLTGKRGPWSIGTLFADDQSPGGSVDPSDPLYGQRAYFSIVRVNHDIGKQSTIGFIYTDRELNTPFHTACTDDPCIIKSNRVGGVDAKFTFSPTWYMQVQALASSTDFNDGTHKGGPAYHWWVEHTTRKVEYNVMYQDTSEGFETATGFFRRPDVRRFSQFAAYTFRPEGKHLVSHGPSVFTIRNWDHKGNRLEWFANTNYKVRFQRQTAFGAFVNAGHELLRPNDFSALSANTDYAHHTYGFFFFNGFSKRISTNGELGWGRSTNYDSPALPVALAPFLAKSNYAQLFLTIRPVGKLTIDNTYLLSRLRTLSAGSAIFNNHIIRSKWNYQFTREFSVRFIGQYNANLANPQFSSLQTTKNFNADVLFTYLVHPGTAIYFGYNSNLENLDPSLTLDPNGNLNRLRNGYINDGRQVFVKVSYLFRF